MPLESKCREIIYFFQKKIIKKICVPTLPKIFRRVTINTLIFYVAYHQLYIDGQFLHVV